MQKVEISNAHKVSQILVGESLANLYKYLPANRRVIYISDEKTWSLYGADLGRDYILIGQGEENKTLKTLEYIYDRLLAMGAHRTTFVVALGGGIVCDVAGFAASTYMRGVDFGFVPTTLLSQVDASVGGKNGVNVASYKNIAGTFTQPNFVLCDAAVLKTLPMFEIANGLAEMVKHALIADWDMLKFIEENVDKINALDADVINQLVLHSVKIKASIVNQDEKESGERRKLNFGHTLGHALEKLGMVKSHGQGVAIGMLFAVKLSIAQGLLPQNFYSRLQLLLKNLHLPCELPKITPEIFAAMTSDKKREDDNIHFIMLNENGAVVRKLEIYELRKLTD